MTDQIKEELDKKKKRDIRLVRDTERTQMCYVNGLIDRDIWREPREIEKASPKGKE